MDKRIIGLMFPILASTSTFAASMDLADRKCAKIAVDNYELADPTKPWMPQIGGPNKNIQIKLIEKNGKIVSFLMKEKGDTSGNVTAVYMKKKDCEEIYKMRFPYNDVVALHPEVMRDLSNRY